MGKKRRVTFEGLSERAMRVQSRYAALALIAAGLNNQESARKLVFGEATVKTHVNDLFAKTGVRDRAQAVAYALRHRLAT